MVSITTAAADASAGANFWLYGLAESLVGIQASVVRNRTAEPECYTASEFIVLEHKE